MVATGQVSSGGGAPHTHAWSEVTGEPDFALAASVDALDVRVDALELAGSAPTWDSISGKPSTFTPSAHTQGWDTITSKPSVFPPDTHTHAYADVTGKPSTFTPSAHTHAWSEVTGKPTTFPPDAHTHAQYAETTAVTTITDALDTRVDALEAAPAPVVWVQYWNGSAYVDAAAARIYIGGPGPSSPVNGDLHVPDA